jgi:hypothetical protein
MARPAEGATCPTAGRSSQSALPHAGRHDRHIRAVRGNIGGNIQIVQWGPTRPPNEPMAIELAPRFAQMLGERTALDVLHDEVGPRVVAEVEHAHEVGM